MMTSTSRQLGGSSRGVHAAVLLGLTALLAVAFTTVIPAEASAAQFGAMVRGKVTDVDGNPIEGVQVTIQPLAQDPTRPVAPIVVVTDEDGNYYARNVTLGDSVIYFEFEGLEPYEDQRELRAGPARIDVTMTAVEIPEEFLRAQVANEAYGAGVDAFNAEDYETAIAHMHEALESMEPENIQGHVYVYGLIGSSYSFLRNFDEAIAAFRTQLEYAPDDADANLDLAQALANSGDQDAARPYYEAALRINPADAVTQYNVGVTMVNGGDVEGGIAHIEMAIELQPVYPTAYKNLGYSYARMEEYAKSIGAFEKYIEQAPEADDVAQIQDFITALKEMIGE